MTNDGTGQTAAGHPPGARVLRVSSEKDICLCHITTYYKSTTTYHMKHLTERGVCYYMLQNKKVRK